MVKNQNKRKHEEISKSTVTTTANKKSNTNKNNKQSTTTNNKNISNNKKNVISNNKSNKPTTKTSAQRNDSVEREEFARLAEVYAKVLDEASSDDDYSQYDSDDFGSDYSDYEEEDDERYYDSDDRAAKEEFEKRMLGYMKEMMAEEGISDDDESDADEDDGSDSEDMKKYVQAIQKNKKQKVEGKSATGSSSTPSAQSSSSSSGVYYNVKFDLPRHKFNRVMCLSVHNTSLHHLHNLLMAAFDWDDGHLHMFHTCKGKFTDRDMCEEGKEESKCKLDSVLNRNVDSIDYVYDFSSEWNISISLEKILSEQAMKSQAERLAINLPNDLTRVAYCCGDLEAQLMRNQEKRKEHLIFSR